MDVAEECLRHAVDLSGLLLLHSALGDVEGMQKLATLAREHGKNNVAFLSLFLLGKLEECIQLLVDRYCKQHSMFRPGCALYIQCPAGS